MNSAKRILLLSPGQEQGGCGLAELQRLCDPCVMVRAGDVETFARELAAFGPDFVVVNSSVSGTELAAARTLVAQRRPGCSVVVLAPEDGASARQDAVAGKRENARVLECLDRLAAGLAHELNNALTPVVMGFPLVREKVQDEPTQRLLDIMETSALRVAEAVRQIMACSRGTSGHKTQVASRRLLDDVIEKVRGSLSPDVPLEVSVGSDLFPVKGNLDHLKEALLNICANAREAMPDGGMLKVTAENCLLDRPFADSLPELRPGAYIRIQVSDTGRGIPPGNLNKVFDPFFTTKPFGLSRGLGLSVALGMVRSHDGGIQIRSELGRGTTVTVYLPAIPVVVPPLTAAAPGPTRKASGKAILLVDDDPEVRAITKTVLELLGHRVITADSGELGLAEFVRYRPAVRAVVTDTAMPGMGGVSLVRTLREMAPEVPIISATGSGEEEKITELKRLGVSRVLQKPYLVSQLVSALEAILGESAP